MREHLPVKPADLAAIMGINPEELKRFKEKKTIQKLFRECNKEERNINTVVPVLTNLFFGLEDISMQNAMGNLIDYVESVRY